MPLDHYVPQVHLKNFYAPNLGDRFYATKKIDLEQFKTNSRSVCRIEDGNTNPYLEEKRAIETFLTGVEPKYNSAVNKLLNDNIDEECIITISGFIAYIWICSPAGMRINFKIMRKYTKETIKIMDKQNFVPGLPGRLGSSPLIINKLKEEGKVLLSKGEKYHQAIVVKEINLFKNGFANSYWEILINEYDDSPFFTSDFPVAIEQSKEPRRVNKIIPLSPNLAIRIIPDIDSDRKNIDFNFSSFRSSRPNLSKQDVMHINRQIVRCAESMVFYRDDADWVSKFIAKNASYRIEPATEGTSRLQVKKI